MRNATDGQLESAQTESQLNQASPNEAQADENSEKLGDPKACVRLGGHPDWTIPAAINAVVEEADDPSRGFTFVNPDKTEYHLTFTEIQAEAQRRGRHLLKMGLGKGDKLAMVVPEPDEFILTFLGAVEVGIIPVPMFPPLGFGKLDAYVDGAANILESGDCSALVTTKQVQTILWSLIDKVPTLDSIVTTEQFVGAARDAPDPEPVYPDDIAFLQFTSGSTSAPKGVMVTHQSLGANLNGIMTHGLEIDLTTDVSISWLPLYHDMGLIGMMLAPVTWGLNAVFIPTLTFVKHPTRWMEVCSKHKATLTFAPNFAFALATRRTREKKLATLDLSHMRAVGCGAEPNHPDTLRAFVEHFEPAGLNPESLLPVYGMAEATLAMSFSKLDESLHTDLVCAESYADEGFAREWDGEVDAAIGSGSNGLSGDGSEGIDVLEYVTCGFPFPKHEIQIIDDEGNQLPDRTLGEVLFKGPSVAAGYYKNPEATRRSFVNGGIRTGDLGYMVDGELFVTGRKKDIIILNGRNYDPQTIEWVAADVQGVRKGNVVAFSRPSSSSEELVVVCEVKDMDADLESIRKQVREAIQSELFLRVAEVSLVPKGTLPKTSSGKLQRAKTRLQFLEGTLGKEGDRTLGQNGQKLIVAKHVARSALSRVRHTVRSRASSLFSVLRGNAPN